MKKNLLNTTLALGLAAAFYGAAFAQETPQAGQIKSFKAVPQVETLDSQADQGLDSFRRRAGEGRLRSLGLNSAADAGQLQKGRPILHYFVRLDQLAAYQSGQDPKSLLGKPSAVTYPLVSGSDIKGAVNLGWDGSQWKVVSVGGPAFIQKWDSLRQGQLSKSGLSLDESFAVRIPALDEDFLGYEDAQGTLFLVPGRDNAILGLHAGEAVPAQDIFLKFAPIAQSYHSKPFH